MTKSTLLPSRDNRPIAYLLKTSQCELFIMDPVGKMQSNLLCRTDLVRSEDKLTECHSQLKDTQMELQVTENVNDKFEVFQTIISTFDVYCMYRYNFR